MIAPQGFDGCVPDGERVTMTDADLQLALEDPATVVRIWHWLVTGDTSDQLEPWCSHEVAGNICRVCGAVVADWEME